MDDPLRKRVAAALGRIPSGCAILTARDGPRRTGMLASWYQQAAFDPPMICAAVKRGRPIETLISSSGTFVLNLLGENCAAMFRHFGPGFALDQDAFAGLAVIETPHGILVPDRIAWLTARVHARHPAGDHWVYFGEVIDADAADDAKPYVHIRKNGLNY